MTVNDAGRRRCIGVDNQVILLADALDLAGVVVQTKVDTLDERQVSADVLVGNRDPSCCMLLGSVNTISSIISSSLNSAPQTTPSKSARVINRKFFSAMVRVFRVHTKYAR